MYYLQWCQKVKNIGVGVPVAIGGDNLPSPIEIGLTDLPNIAGASGPLAPPVPAPLQCMHLHTQFFADHKHSTRISILFFYLIFAHQDQKVAVTSTPVLYTVDL